MYASGRVHGQVEQSAEYLGRILAGRSSHQGEAGEGHHAVHKGFARAQRIIEELAHGQGEVQTTGKYRNHLNGMSCAVGPEAFDGIPDAYIGIGLSAT